MRRKSQQTLLSTMVFIALLLTSVPLVAASSSWTKRRPSEYTLYQEKAGNENGDGVCSIALGVDIFEYIPDPGLGYDRLVFRLDVSANTRTEIEYQCGCDIYNWYEVSQPTGITDDNNGTWIDTFTFLYYGMEYHKVWVCSNGFLCLNTTSTSPNPQSIPNTEEPNPIIAAFWRDLHPEQGGTITYGFVNYDQYLVISWNKVPDDSNIPQTFQIVIEVQNDPLCSNNIFFQYKNVTKGHFTVVGIEDQLGQRGDSYDYQDLENGLCLKCNALTAGYRLTRLAINITKDDDDAKITIDADEVGGYNVDLISNEDRWGDVYASSIEVAAELLVGVLLGGGAGIAFQAMIITAEVADILSGGLSPADAEIDSAGRGEDEASIVTPCVWEYKSLYPFDSSLAATIYWKFYDDYDMDHSLTISAEAEYKSEFNESYDKISTSTTLNMYINSPPDVPYRPAGEDDGKTDESLTYYTGTDDPDGDNVYYQFYWDDGSNTTIGPYESGEGVSASHSWDSEGTYDVKVRARDPYTSWGDWSPEHSVYITEGGGGGAGGACPTLFVWNGTGYVDYGVIDIHDPSGEDVIREVPVSAEDVDTSGYKARFRLREGWEGLNFSESVIDQVKLYTTVDGEQRLCPLIKATHNEHRNVYLWLLFSDEWKTQICLLETIDLQFIVPYQNTESFTFIIEGCNMLKM